MASSDDLWKAMRAALQASGDLIHLRAKVEESISEALQQQSVPQCMSETVTFHPSKTTKPIMPPEIVLANSLIKEYLDHSGLQMTADVLSLECGLPEDYLLNKTLKAKFSSLPHTNKPLLTIMTEEYISSTTGNKDSSSYVKDKRQ